MSPKSLLTYFFGLIMALCGASFAQAAISGKDLVTNKAIEVKPGKKGTVLVFLSASCPCSNAHVDVMKKLAADFKDFTFVAVHSNANEPMELSKKYFTAAKLPFSVIEDSKTKIADEYKAFKTPHAYVLSPEGKIVYKGGVTSSANALPSDKQYLRNALADLNEDKEVQQSETRTLGCVIARD